MPLYRRDRCPPRLSDERKGFVVQWILLAAPGFIPLCPRCRCPERGAINYGLEVLGHTAFLQLLCDTMHFLIRDKRAVNTDWKAGPGWKKQHIPVTKELFCTHLIQNGPRIRPRRNLKRDSSGNIGLNQAGYHVYGGSLRSKYQVNSRCPGPLSDSGNQLFYFFTNDHQEIGKLIDNDYYIGNFPELGRRRDVTGQRLEQWIIQRLATVDCRFYFPVVSNDIANSKSCHETKTPIHLHDAPT